MKDTDTVDFVVPCGRPKSAQSRLCLDALAAVTEQLGGNVFVVGPRFDTIRSHYPSNFHWHPTGKLVWPSTARNIGASFSEKPLILFIDDDVVVTSAVVQATIDRFADNPGLGLLSGQIVGASDDYLGRSFDYCGFSYQQALADRWDTPLLVSAYMCVRRAIFAELGGFDQAIETAEDVDLVYRVLEAGWRTLYASDIVVTHHHDRDTWRKFLVYQYGHGSRPLHVEAKRREKSLRATVKIALRPIAPLLFPAYLMVNVARILATNFPSRPGIIWYIPGIVVGRLAFELGRAINGSRRRATENRDAK